MKMKKYSIVVTTLLTKQYVIEAGDKLLACKKAYELSGRDCITVNQDVQTHDVLERSIELCDEIE